MDSKTTSEYLPSAFAVPPRYDAGNNRGCFSMVTAVIMTAVLCAGLIAAAIVFQNGGHSVTCPGAVGTAVEARQAVQPIALTADKVKRADLATGKGGHLSERFDYDKQSNTVLIESPANISSDNSAATMAVDLDRNVMFISIHDSDTCIGLSIDHEFAQQVRDYVEENDNNEIDLSNVAFDIESYRLVGEIPTAYLKTSNGPVIRGLCAGRNAYWALPSTEEEHDRMKREDIDCGIFKACFCLFHLCACRYVIGCFDMDELRADGWEIN